MSKKKNNGFFERFANAATKFTGSSPAFIAAALIVVAWAFSGPIFDYSETWQLVINTGTTIITFLMVFLIQKAQNKDSKAIQLKLNELIAANRYASNRMVDIEDLTEEELDQLHKFYVKISDLAEKEEDIHNSHSIDAAVTSNELKVKARKAGSAGSDIEPEVKAAQEEIKLVADEAKKALRTKQVTPKNNRSTHAGKSKKG